MASYKLIVKNAKVILKTVTNAVLNITGIKDLLTGSGSVDSNTKIDWTLQHYTNTATNFTSTNPILLVGQLGIETDDLLTAPKYKIGDGVTAWNTLPYNSSGGGGLSGLTTNKVLKATSSTTAGDSNITDDGTTVTVNSPAIITSDAGNNQIISIDNLKALVAHDVKILFNSPIYSFANTQANETVETDASKNLVSVAKGTAYNKDFGTTAGTVLEGNRITQTITNGVTDKVPSEDAVFDGLATKLEITNNLSDLNNAITARTTNLKMYDMFLTNGNQTTTSNVAANITDLVSPTLTANKRYKIFGTLHVGCNNTGGVKFQIKIPTGATLFIDGFGNTSGLSTNVFLTTSSATLSPAFCTTNNTNGFINISMGEIELSSTAGVIQFGFASATNTQTSTVYQLGTQLTLTQIN